MQSSDLPTRFQIPFANNAGAGFVRSVPVASQIGITNGAASLTDGFPPLTFQPVGSGGVPPFGADMNGILRQSTQWNQWQAAGGAFVPWNSDFSTAIGGYFAGAVVASAAVSGLLWLCLVDNNTSNPDQGGSGWYRFFQAQTGNLNLYVNGTTGNDNNNGLSPGTAVATIQQAINLAFQLPPSQFVVNINIADGTYARAATLAYSGPSIAVIGNSITPSNVTINNTTGTNAHCLVVQGPNTMSVTGVKVQNSGTASGGFVAVSGGSMATTNTASGTISSGAVFEAFEAQVNVNGPHTFSGNVSNAFIGSAGGIIQLATGVSHTISTPITVSTFALAISLGLITCSSPVPTFTGTVTGTRYSAALNGVINISGGGANVFPGTVAGSTATGGQYN